MDYTYSQKLTGYNLFIWLCSINVLKCYYFHKVMNFGSDDLFHKQSLAAFLRWLLSFTVKFTENFPL